MNLAVIEALEIPGNFDAWCGQGLWILREWRFI